MRNTLKKLVVRVSAARATGAYRLQVVMRYFSRTAFLNESRTIEYATAAFGAVTTCGQ